MLQNHYKILGVNTNASAAEIKSSFRKLALEWHPDKNSSKSATEKFIEINTAYEILVDSYKRLEYDKLCSDYLNSTQLENAEFNNSIFNEYQKWTNDIQQKSSERAKMAYSDFLKEVGFKIKRSFNFSFTLIGIGIIAYLGIYGSFVFIKSIIISIIRSVRTDAPFHVPFIAWFLGAICCLFSFIIILALIKLIRNSFEEN